MFPKHTRPTSRTPKYNPVEGRPAPCRVYIMACKRLQQIEAYRTREAGSLQQTYREQVDTLEQAFREVKRQHQEALEAARLAHKQRLAALEATLSPLEEKYKQEKKQADKERRQHFGIANFLFVDRTKMEKGEEAILVREAVRDGERELVEIRSQYSGRWIQFDTDTGQPIRWWEGPMYTMRDEYPPWLRRSFRGYVLTGDVTYSVMPDWVRATVRGGVPMYDPDDIPEVGPLEIPPPSDLSFV